MPDSEIRSDYDDIADAYRESKKHSFRSVIEEHTLFTVAGDVSGLDIVDLACGEGHYTRKLKAAGAASILGVDLSAEMMKLAIEAEQADPLGCTYLQQDASTLELEKQVDLVVGMFLLNYARSFNELLAFTRSAFRLLKSGGRFIGFNDNPLMGATDVGFYTQYQFEKIRKPDAMPGDVIIYRVTNLDGTVFDIINYYQPPEVYTTAFEEAGFADFKWDGPYLHPDAQGDPHWDRFMQSPPCNGFTATKP